MTAEQEQADRPTRTPHGPLAGLRVIELAGIGPGPFAAMLLADMGADVLSIERPQGSTSVVPPEQDILRRSKRSVTVDLRSPEGVETVLTLVERADVLLEGYRPGVAERLGVGPDVCWTRNPALVYGRMTGWGQDGPLARAAGHDIGYIAITGALGAMGRADGPPAIPLNLVGDFGGGSTYLVMGVLAALYEAERSGRGQVVDAAIVDGAASLIAPMHGMLHSGLWRDARGTNMLDSGLPWYDVYETRDHEWMAVGALEPRFYAEFLRLLDIDAEAGARGDRRRWPALRERFAAAFAKRTRGEWSEIFEGSDACVSPVLGLREATQHPHLSARGTFVEIDGVTQPAPAPRFSRTPSAVQRPPAALGAHTREALTEWGVADVDRRIADRTAVRSADGGEHSTVGDHHPVPPAHAKGTAVTSLPSSTIYGAPRAPVPIGVGIVGLSAKAGWASTAHVPALAALHGAFELRALTASSAESAKAAGEKFGIPLAFDSVEDMLARDEVDLVVVSVKVPDHLELVMAVLAAGKSVLSEWPLGNGTAEAEKMAAFADSRSLRGFVGLQARFAPPVRYLHDLVADGYVGQVLSTSVIASGPSWGATFDDRDAYLADSANGATMMSIPFGHTMDGLASVLGEFTQLSATLANRRPEVRHTKTGQIVARDVDDQIAVTGTLGSGAVAAVHYRGGVSRSTNFLWEINGTEGDLLITGESGHLQFGQITIHGARGLNTELTEQPVPASYDTSVPALADARDTMAYTVAHAYAQLHADLTEGTHTVPDFNHAVRHHHLLDHIQRAASTGHRQHISS